MGLRRHSVRLWFVLDLPHRANRKIEAEGITIRESIAHGVPVYGLETLFSGSGLVAVPIGKWVAVGYRRWEKSVPVKCMPVAFSLLTDLNLARLPIPPHPHVFGTLSLPTSDGWVRGRDCGCGLDTAPKPAVSSGAPPADFFVACLRLAQAFQARRDGRQIARRRSIRLARLRLPLLVPFGDVIA